MQALFLGMIGSVLIYSEYCGCSKFLIFLSNLVRVHIFKKDWFDKVFWVKFYHSCVYFCYLKKCTGFFGKPYNGCSCACCRMAISLIVFARESDSLIKYCVIF